MSYGHESYGSNDSKVILKSKAVAVEIPSPPKIPDVIIAKSIEEYSFQWLKPIIRSICDDYDDLKSEKNTLTEALAALPQPTEYLNKISFPSIADDLNLDPISRREFEELNNPLYDDFKLDTATRLLLFKKFHIEARLTLIDKTIDDLLSEASIAYKVENKYFEIFDDVKYTNSQYNRQLTAIQRGISWIRYSPEIRNIRTRSGYSISKIFYIILCSFHYNYYQW